MKNSESRNRNYTIHFRICGWWFDLLRFLIFTFFTFWQSTESGEFRIYKWMMCDEFWKVSLVVWFVEIFDIYILHFLVQYRKWRIQNLEIETIRYIFESVVGGLISWDLWYISSLFGTVQSVMNLESINEYCVMNFWN